MRGAETLFASKLKKEAFEQCRAMMWRCPCAAATTRSSSLTFPVAVPNEHKDIAHLKNAIKPVWNDDPARHAIGCGRHVDGAD